jgi:hypothetical protein
MDRIGYDQVRAHVEELIYKWQEATLLRPMSHFEGHNGHT